MLVYEVIAEPVHPADWERMAERLGETDVATSDRRDLGVVRPLHCEAFTLLP